MGRPREAKASQVFFGDIAWLVGYNVVLSRTSEGLGHPVPAQKIAINLYWQPTKKLNLAYAEAFHLCFRLFAEDSAEPLWTEIHPFLPQGPESGKLTLGLVLPQSYKS